jgi:hypothetical protein
MRPGTPFARAALQEFRPGLGMEDPQTNPSKLLESLPKSSESAKKHAQNPPKFGRKSTYAKDF